MLARICTGYGKGRGMCLASWMGYISGILLFHPHSFLYNRCQSHCINKASGWLALGGGEEDALFWGRHGFL